MMIAILAALVSLAVGAPQAGFQDGLSSGFDNGGATILPITPQRPQLLPVTSWPTESSTLQQQPTKRQEQTTTQPQSSSSSSSSSSSPFNFQFGIPGFNSGFTLRPENAWNFALDPFQQFFGYFGSRPFSPQRPQQSTTTSSLNTASTRQLGPGFNFATGFNGGFNLPISPEQFFSIFPVPQNQANNRPSESETKKLRSVRETRKNKSLL